jgi:hypothetical protein
MGFGEVNKIAFSQKYGCLFIDLDRGGEYLLRRFTYNVDGYAELTPRNLESFVTAIAVNDKADLLYVGTQWFDYLHIYDL